ncbi:MAG: 50S ribosomal protein L24 [Candidatus Micrarchaeia archaeon]|jgi:large subunit ribosomal protein L24
MKPDIERKKRYNAPLHQKRKFMRINLSKELKVKMKKRNVLAKKEDTIKVMRGSFKGKEAKIAKISYVKEKIYLEGISKKTARAREMLIPFEPSNLMITALGERDKIKDKKVN